MTTVDTQVVYTTIDSPIGTLLLSGDEQGLSGVYMELHKGGLLPTAQWQQDDEALAPAAEQLRAYFDGRLRKFDVPLSLHGTDFQLQVWHALCEIPFGQTISYGELARRIGKPQAMRAVGAANGRNPVSIIVPCHRVVGSTGSLTGFGGGLPRKRWLLDHEGAVSHGGQRPLTLHQG
jgi:methylated-DNA-[protein]-cysteine S-methyltransferase